MRSHFLVFQLWGPRGYFKMFDFKLGFHDPNLAKGTHLRIMATGRKGWTLDLVGFCS